MTSCNSLTQNLFSSSKRTNDMTSRALAASSIFMYDQFLCNSMGGSTKSRKQTNCGKNGFVPGKTPPQTEFFARPSPKFVLFQRRVTTPSLKQNKFARFSDMSKKRSFLSAFGSVGDDFAEDDVRLSRQGAASRGALFFCAIIVFNSLRNLSKLTRSAILPPSMSPWRKLWADGDDKSFLTMTGFSRHAFRLLHEALWTSNALGGSYSPVGRPSILTNVDRLGLVLFYLGSKVTLSELCMLFGVSVSLCGETINDMLRLICHRLKDQTDAEIAFPGPAKKAEYAAMVHAREPSVHNCIGFIDGCSIATQCSDEPVAQSSHYNGYYHDTAVNNVFAFAPDGKIIYACINYPGSWHDTSVCSDLINLCVRKIGDYCFCVDQGFPPSGALHGKFVGPINKKKKKKLDPRLRDLILSQCDVYTSLRQASEWGMRALQGTFIRLKSRLPSDNKKRHNILLSVALLHNFRTVHVGLNQIAAVFNLEYEQYINVNGYDRIARYFGM